MDKPDTNLGKQALLEGQVTCGGEDLLTECKEWCKKLNISCVTKGVPKDIQKAEEENLKFKKALWRENYKEIRTEMDKLSKVKDLKMPTTKREINHLKGINMMDASVWFRYRCKITAHIKGNKSSMYKENKQC